MNARTDAADREAASFEAAYRDFCTDTTQSLTEAFNGKTDGTVEFYSHGEGKTMSEPARDAILTEVTEPAAEGALFDALRHSDCPYVAALRLAVINGYTQRNAEFVAGARVGS